MFGAPHARNMYLSLVNNLEMIKKSFDEVPMLTHHEKLVTQHKCMQRLFIRHSRLPAGNALWFCQNIIIFYFFYLFFLRPPPRFPDDNF